MSRFKWKQLTPVSRLLYLPLPSLRPDSQGQDERRLHNLSQIFLVLIELLGFIILHNGAKFTLEWEPDA